MKRWKHVSLTLTVALASACSMLPKGPQIEPVERPELPDAFPAQGEVAAALTPRWWTLYGDEALTRLIESALVANSDIRLAVAQIEEAEGVLREAGAAQWPQVDLAGTGTRSRISTRVATPVPPSVPVWRNDRRLGASTAFELDFWGRLSNARDAARAQWLATRFSADVVRLTLSSTVAQVWFTLQSVDVQVDLLRDSLRLREETLSVVRSRARAGLVSDLDLAQAEGALADVAAQIDELQRQRAVLEHQLGALTAQPRLRVALPGKARLSTLPPPVPVGLPSSLLERRPDIQLAEQNLVAAQARLAVARAALYPSISLTSQAGGNSVNTSDLLLGAARFWSLGLAFNLPIFDGGRIEARIDQTAARQRQLLASYQKALESAFRDVADAISNQEMAAASERDLQSRADAARRAIDLARKRYDAGYSPYLELLDAQRTFNDASLALIRARQARLGYSVDLMKALGGGWSGEDALQAAAQSLPTGNEKR